MFWAKMAFKQEVESGLRMQRAWKKQVPKLGLAKRPWQKVAGPAGATTMTLKKLHWKASSAFSWQTEKGVNLDLRHIAPYTVKKLIEDAVEAAIWDEWANTPASKNEKFIRHRGGYWMPAVQKLAEGKAKD